MVESVRRVKCTVMYHGAHFDGWQRQPHGRTVQSTIEDVLTRMHQRPVSITGSGRTDAKVHALGQVFHFDTPLKIDESAWINAFRAQLPLDVQVIEVAFVPSTFHARFGVIRKQYEYLVYKGPIQPFNYETHCCVESTLNVEAMRKAVSVLIGTHDFSAFCANSLKETPNQVRTIMRFEVEESDDELRFVIEGDGFMRYQIRMMMACVLDIGRGKLRITDMKQILDSRDKQAYSGMAEACGLYLTEVVYR